MLDALTLDQMRVFVAVAESGSFRAAPLFGLPRAGELFGDQARRVHA